MQYKQVKVLKDWNVTDENVSYTGEYVPGDMVVVPSDNCGQLVQAGFVEVVGDFPSASAPADIKGLEKLKTNVAQAESATPVDTRTEEKVTHSDDKDEE
jgi:hypothetical protein